MKRPPLHIILLRLLLLPIPFLPVFYAFLFSLQQKAIPGQMQEELRKKELASVIVIKKEVKWLEQGKEVLLPDGRLFDISSVTTDENYYYFTGLYDERESELASAQEEFEEENAEGQKVNNPVTGIPDIFFESTDPALSLPLSTGDHILNNNAFLPFQIKVVITPPPEKLFA